MGSPLEELNYCIDLWGKQGYCTFGRRTRCIECGTPYILWKLVTGEILHGEDMERLQLWDWRRLVDRFENPIDSSFLPGKKEL